jgi:hypothetical protein
MPLISIQINVFLNVDFGVLLGLQQLHTCLAPMLGTIIKLGNFEEMWKIKDTKLKECLIYIISHGHIIFNGHSNYEKLNHITRCLGMYA